MENAWGESWGEAPSWDRAEGWRREQFWRLGFDEDHADDLARVKADYREAQVLLERGCTHEWAYELLRED